MKKMSMVIAKSIQNQTLINLQPMTVEI